MPNDVPTVTTRRRHRSRLLDAALGVCLLAGGVFIGATAQQPVSADVSSGDRPVLISITPCRLADTRPAPDQVGPRSAPLSAGDVHTIDTQESGTPCSDQIPTDALALALNVTALNATQLSFLTIWAGGDRPTAASLNPAPGQPPVPNAVTTQLSVDQEFEIYNNAGSVDVVVDVTGYYVGHDHDDRYYTKAQSDDRYFSTTESDDRYYTKSESDDRYFDATEVAAAIEEALVAERAKRAGERVAVGSVFANDPPDLSGVIAADGYEVSVSAPVTEGRQVLTVQVPPNTTFPEILVTPLLGSPGDSCRVSTSSFGVAYSATIECADASGTKVDISFNFAIYADTTT